MATSVRIFFVDRTSEHLDRAQEESAVLLRGLLQFKYELFQVVRHRVERLRQFADLSPAMDVHAMAEIAAGDGPAALSQHLQGISDTSRGKNTDEQAQQDRCDGQQHGRA